MPAAVPACIMQPNNRQPSNQHHKMAHKAGFVNIVGNPNVGKSTLMNCLTGENLSIITSRSQTTRHRILGILNGEDFQVVYSDTPGVLKPAYKLQKAMLRFARSALEDADILLYVTDVFEQKEKNQQFLEAVDKLEIPVLVLINKTDLSNQDHIESLVEEWHHMLPNAHILPVAALLKFNTEMVFDFILKHLPESPPFFPKDQLSDKTQRFFVSEMIREKILLNYRKEVPYATEVEVTAFKEDPQLVSIEATIYVARESQKGIIIGHRGQALKKTGTDARKAIEAWLEKKVYLNLIVKVKKDWRDKNQDLENFGYQAT